MKFLLKRIVTNILGRKPKDTVIKEFYKAGDNTNFDAFNNLDVRDKSISRIFLEIGNDCLIGSKFVFENRNGFIKIGNRTSIGGGTSFISIDRIEVGDDVLISWGCTIVDNNSHSLYWKERKDDVINWKRGVEENTIGAYKDWSIVKKFPVFIKDKVWIGFNVIILKGVTIGEGAIVGAGSVVTKDIPDYAVVAGNPARILKYTT